MISVNYIQNYTVAAVYFCYFCKCLFTSKEPCASGKWKMENGKWKSHLTWRLKFRFKLIPEDSSEPVHGSFHQVCIDFLENTRKSFNLVSRISNPLASTEVQFNQAFPEVFLYHTGILCWRQVPQPLHFQSGWLWNGIQWTKFCFAPDHF